MSEKKAEKNFRAPVAYVTGKGGSGKTFVAQALAAAAAARGLRTCIVTAPAEAPGNERASEDAGVERICCTPAEALGRLLVRTVRFQFIANRLMDSSTFTAVADAAPGIADIAFLGLLDEISTDRSEGAAYDLVVVDAPASGHSAILLRAPESVGRIAAIGPAATIVARTRELVSDPRRLRPVIVCPPEELAVVETLSLLESLRDDGIAAPLVVANATYPAPGNEPQLAWLREHAVGKDAELYIGRFDRQCELLDRLRAAAPALCEIPRAFPTTQNGRTGATADSTQGAFESTETAIEKLLDRVLERPKARRTKSKNKPLDKTRGKKSGKSAAATARKPRTKKSPPGGAQRPA